MNSVAIGLILTGFIALILSLSIFWGIKRGLKKTLFRLAWIIVSSIILFFTVQPLSNWLNSFDLSGLNLDIFGKVTKLSDIGVNIVNSIEGGADVLQSSEELAFFVECLPTLILNILLFVIMFWVLKALLWLIWAPISTRIFDKQKLVLKKREKEQKKLKAKNPAAVMQQDQEPFVINIKQNKHRGWGAIAGFVLGLIVCAVTFSPIIGLNSIYQTVYASIMAEDESGNKVPYLTQVIDEDTRGYIESYETSIGGKILKYTGVEFFSNLMFGGLTTVNVGEEKVSLVGEVSTAAKVFKGINNLTTFDTDNINQDNLDKFIVDLKEISTDIKGSTIVYFVANHVMPYIIDDFLEQNDIVLIDGGVLDQAVIDAYKEFSKDFDFGKLQDQLTSLLDVASILNYYDLLAPIFNNEVTNLQQAVDLIGTKATNDGLADIVVDGLFNIDILKNEYPALISAGVNSIFNGLDLQYAQQDIESNQLKEDLSIIFTNIFRFCRYYSKSVNLDFGEDTVNTMSSIGIVLNTLKQGIINNQNFAQLISYFEKTLNSALKDVVDLTSIVEGVNNVEDWENELLALATPYKTIVKLVNAAPSVESIMAGEFDSHIKNVGNGLDSALTGESLLINNQNIRVALEAFLNKIDTSSFDEILDIQIDSALTLKQQLLNNIYSLSTQQSKIKSWKNEFEYNLDLVKAVFNLNKDSFDIEKLSNSQNNQLEETGLAIDNAIKRTNLIVSGKVFSKVANYFLDKVVFPEEVDQILNIKGSSNKTVLEIVLANISSGDDIINYQQEFLKIKNVLKVDFENASFVELGSMLDNLLGSNIFTKNEVVNSVVKYYIDQETTTLDSGLKTAIDLMKNNLNSVVSYVKEFEHIEDLLAVLDAEYQTSAEQYAAFGRQFNIMSGYDGFAGLQSNIFTKEVINTFICYYFDEFITNNLQDIPQDIKDIVEDVKGNLAKAKDYNIDINYERELNNFLELADCVDGSVLDLNGDGAQDLRDIGSVLDDMKSEIITPSVIKNLIAFYIEEETDSLDADLKTIVKDVVDTIKSDKTTISSYEREFDLLLQLTDHIKSSSIDFGSVGKSFDKLQNQSSVVSRQVLESLINYFFTDFIETNLIGPEQEDFKNAVEDIAKNIPEIESFEKEFANLDLLFENVENSDIVELGAILDQIVNSNSKLIKKDPNINGIVAYFFDAYVNKNLDAEGDKDLIKVINDVKQNIALIESYTREFSYLNMLFEKVNVVNIAEIGGVLDNIAASNSKLIKKDPNMYDIVTYFFDKFIEQKLDVVEEAELIEIIDGIKTNVNQIESFATEFNYLEDLLNGANNTNTIAIGAVLDNIATANSKLIKKDPNMYDIVTYFFDKFINEKLSAASDAELIEIIDGIKANVNQIESFATEFNHLETLLNGANNTNTIAIGAVLDNIAAANSKLIKKDPNMYDIVAYFC
ncbi:MAG: hypothetical protein IJD48_01555, partial [Clostridia bacterium]|nr:hypothetical protein [Clostridia bacterium]